MPLLLIQLTIVSFWINPTCQLLSRKRKNKTPKTEFYRPTDVRSYIGSKKRGKMASRKNLIDPVDPMAEVLTEVVKEIDGKSSCHILLYYDTAVVSEKQLRQFQENLNTAVTLLNVMNLKFSLITKSRLISSRTPLVDLLLTRNDQHRCRILVAWASEHYQRGLLLIARKESGVLNSEDSLILPTKTQRISRFLPKLKHRIIVQEVNKPRLGSRGARSLNTKKYLIDRTCDWCKDISLLRVGEWKQIDGWIKKSLNVKSSGLNGAKLTVSYTNSIPNIFPITVNNKTVLEGLEVRMLQYASTALNFTVNFKQPKDGEWGRRINNTWTGKIGDIVSKKADLAIGGIVYKSDRARVGAYSVLFHRELWSIVCPPPDKLPVWPYIMFPFREESARSIISFLVLLHVLAYVVAVFIGNQRAQTEDDGHPLQQPFNNVLKTGVSLYFRMLACLYFWNLYYCIIQPKYEETIDSASALLRGKNSWGIVKGTTVKTVLEASYDYSHREVASRAIELSSISEGFQKLRSSGLCLLGVPKRYAKSTISTQHTTECGESALTVSEENLHTVLGGWFVAKSSPIIRDLNQIIRRLQVFGFIDKWQKDLYLMLETSTPSKLPCIGKPITSLSLSNLRLAFFLLLAGLGLAICSFFLENIFSFILGGDNPKYVTWSRASSEKSLVPQRYIHPRHLRSRNWIIQMLLTSPTSQQLLLKELQLRQQLAQILREIHSPSPS